MTDFDKGKMFHRLSPDERQAGEHGAPAGEKDDYTPVIPVPKDAPAPDWNKLRPTKATGDPVWTWPYHTAENELALYVALWKPKDPNARKKKVIRPATWDGTEWKLKGMPAPRPLYRLPAILESPDKLVIVVEGETCADAGRDVFPAHIVTTWAGGSDAVDKTDWSPLAGRTVFLLADRDAPGRKAVEAIADNLAGMDANVSVHLPEDEDKQDIADWLKADGAEATGARIDIDRNDHRETWAVGSQGFADWLRERYFTECDGAPNNEAFQAAMNTIKASAVCGSTEAEVCKRVGSDGGYLYLDLCKPQWEAVEITSTGWRIVAKPNCASCAHWPCVSCRRRRATVALRIFAAF